MFKCKRGIVMIEALAVMAILQAAFIGTIAVAQRMPHDAFRNRKAVEKCMSTQIGVSEEACNSAIAGFSSEEVLLYIKDIDTSGNGGYVN